MINLLPHVAKKAVIKEYWLRVLSVWMFVLGTGCLLWASFLLPTYVLVRQEKISLEAEVIQKASVAASYDTSAFALTAAMDQAKLLIATPETVPFTQYQDIINKYSGTNIELLSVSYLRQESGVKITLQGVARTRQALATFRDDLEKDSYFADAVLPISSLVKDSNLDFSMTVTGLSIEKL